MIMNEEKNPPYHYFFSRIFACQNCVVFRRIAFAVNGSWSQHQTILGKSCLAELNCRHSECSLVHVALLLLLILSAIDFEKVSKKVDFYFFFKCSKSQSKAVSKNPQV